MKYKSKTKSKKIALKVPCILTFQDYHEISYVRDYFNELLVEKIKSKELPTYGEHSAIFYFKRDQEYKDLIKEYNRVNKEEYD